MDFNLVVVLVVVGLGGLWIVASPLLRAIVLDTLRHPNRAAVFEVEDGGVTVTPKDLRPIELAIGKVSYVETVWTTTVLREMSVAPVGWPRLLAVSSSQPEEAIRRLHPSRVRSE
jgi:hypothetical protein